LSSQQKRIKNTSNRGEETINPLAQILLIEPCKDISNVVHFNHQSEEFKLYPMANQFKRTALAGAVLLSLLSGTVHAQSPASQKKEIEALRAQLQQLIKENQAKDGAGTQASAVEELKKQVQELKALVNAQRTGTETPAVVASNPAPGEEPDQATLDAATSATKADIQGIRTDFENYKYDQARTDDRKRASVNRNTTISGTVALRGTAQNIAQNAGVANGATGGGTTYQAESRQNGFDIGSASLKFAGNLYRDYAEGKNLTYVLGFAYGSNFSGSPSSATSATRTLGVASANGSQFNLNDAYLAYSFFPTNGGIEDAKGTLTFGQQQVPFGLEAQTDEEVRPVITSAQFTSSLNGIKDRQIGLVYRGDSFVNVDWTNNYRSALLEYAFGVVNGSGPNKSDNNTQKDIIGRIAVTIPAEYNSWLRQLKLGTSYYQGSNPLVNNNTTNAVQVSKSTIRGFDINWTHLPYSIAYEYAQGRDEVFKTATGTTTNTSPLVIKPSKGQYINFGYSWGEQFLSSEKSLAKYDDFWPKTYQLFFRYDTFDKDTRVGDKTNISTLGLNTFFAETTKLQFNYLVTRNEDTTVSYTAANRPKETKAIQVQFQYGF
jgi:phosphate-selective porin